MHPVLQSFAQLLEQKILHVSEQPSSHEPVQLEHEPLHPNSHEPVQLEHEPLHPKEQDPVQLEQPLEQPNQQFAHDCPEAKALNGN